MASGLSGCRKNLRGFSTEGMQPPARALRRGEQPLAALEKPLHVPSNYGILDKRSYDGLSGPSAKWWLALFLLT